MQDLAPCALTIAAKSLHTRANARPPETGSASGLRPLALRARSPSQKEGLADGSPSLNGRMRVRSSLGEVGRGDELLPLALATEPDVAIVDIEMPVRDGLSAASELHAALPACKTLILTMYGRPGFVHRALQGGVAGFVLNDAPIEKLAMAVRRCAAGENVVDPELAARALRAGASPLCSREQKILGACAEGLATAEVARRVWLSEGTVRNRISEILGKLGVRTRGEAVQVAREDGWL